MLAVLTDLAQIAALAEAHRDDDDAFGHYIAIMWEREGRDPAALDALVETIAADVIPRIDCSACANCCRSITVGLEPDDVPRLAVGLDLSLDETMARYVDRERGAQEDEWGVIRSSPCPLLAGKRCSIYAHRPQSCRDYPALTPDFLYLYPVIVQGAGLCPIIFNVIERLKAALGWEPAPLQP